MKKTINKYYNMPERDDRVNIDHLNQNATALDVDINSIEVSLKTKAPIHSPQFSGEPTAPKPGDETKKERIATVGFVADALEVEVL